MAAAFSGMVSAGRASGPYPAVQATVLPSWRSITGEGCALPSAALVSVMSVSRFSSGRSAVKSRSDQVPTRAGVISPPWEPHLRRPEHAPRARPRP